MHVHRKTDSITMLRFMTNNFLIGKIQHLTYFNDRTRQLMTSLEIVLLEMKPINDKFKVLI